jgi:2-pyrone-4,6-dicarboxylate lactonase
MTITRRAFNAMMAASAAAAVLPHGANAANLASIMPPGAIDVHNHIMGPQSKYPYAPTRAYTPPEASVADVKALRAQIGTARNVIVSPSVYGFDNSCMVDAVAELGNTARGIAVLPPDVSDAEIARLEKANVRGSRLNTGLKNLSEQIDALAPKYKPLNWHIQLVGQLPLILAQADRIARLPIPVVVDHFGGARGEDGTDTKDFHAFLDLVRAGNVYVKLSAPYDRTRQPGYENMTPFARALIAARADRMLWGTNWPHPGQDGRPITQVSPYQKVDNLLLVTRLMEWCPDAATRKTILADTPARLYRFA